MDKNIEILPKIAIDEFQTIYQKSFQVLLPREEVKEKANNFLRLFALITNQPINTNE